MAIDLLEWLKSIFQPVVSVEGSQSYVNVDPTIYDMKHYIKYPVKILRYAGTSGDGIILDVGKHSVVFIVGAVAMNSNQAVAAIIKIYPDNRILGSRFVLPIKISTGAGDKVSLLGDLPLPLVLSRYARFSIEDEDWNPGDTNEYQILYYEVYV